MTKAATIDPVLDPVTRLSNLLCATANPRDPAAFVQLLADFTMAAVREAFERQDEIRERLRMPRPLVSAADIARGDAPASRDDKHSGPSRGTQCPWCYAMILGPIIEHDCTRKRELGFDQSRSTGAAAAVPSAAKGTTDTVTASETPQAAPSNEHAEISTNHGDHDGTSIPATRRLDERQPHGEQPHAAQVSRSLGRGEGADAGAEGRGPGVREHAASDRRDGREQRASGVARTVVGADEDRRSRHVGGEARHALEQPLAKPASSKTEGVVGTAPSGDAGTPPAEPGPGVEGSQLSRRGRKPTFSDDECRLMRANWLAARARNPKTNWVEQEAAARRVTAKTIRRAMQRAKGLPAMQPRPRVANGQSKPAVRAHANTAECWCRTELPGEQWCALQTSPPAQNIPQNIPPADDAKPVKHETETHVHTNSHGCWCRKKPGGKANPWCTIAKPDKPIASLAGLQDPRPRVERYRREVR